MQTQRGTCGNVGGGAETDKREGVAQREVMSFRALSSSSLMALYFIFWA